MLKHFRSSPLWLIGLFVLFAEGISAIAAIQLEGWPQKALVIFVIAYATLVTAVFFLFLWLKPENFYSPADYAETTPEGFINALRRLPTDLSQAVDTLNADPDSKSKLFQLLEALIADHVLQNLVLIHRLGGRLDVSKLSESGVAHTYEFLSRTSSYSMGIFMPGQFVHNLKGTGLVVMNPTTKEIVLQKDGSEFAKWLIDNAKDALSFKCENGGWGDEADLRSEFRKNG